MKLPKVKKKVATLVVGGVLIASATTAGALMLTKPFDQARQANIETSPTQNQLPNSSQTEISGELADTEPTVSPSPTPTPTPSPTSSTPTNPYSQETMGYYVFNKRIAAGKVAGSWGLPNSWVSSAKNAGLAVDRVPQKYDAGVAGGTVWFVESVNDDGSIVVTSYNTGALGTGLATRTIPTNQFTVWQFIH